jgi:hypothetical protein
MTYPLYIFTAFELYDQQDQFEWTQREGADVTRENTIGTEPFRQQQRQLHPRKLRIKYMEPF